ncbi:MAG TPA: hypothetical protein VKR58_07210 [Aquella sp.]|nr:hypothetical protein [Aquella sp.]
MKNSSDYEKGFYDAFGKIDNEIDKFFDELKEMKKVLDSHDWTIHEISGAMLALAMFKRTIKELFLMKIDFEDK